MNDSLEKREADFLRSLKDYEKFKKLESTKKAEDSNVPTWLK